MHAIDAVISQPWAIQTEWLEMIAAIAQRQFDAPVVAAMRDNAPRAAEAGLVVQDGVAVIGITGPIFPRANLMTAMSGATSIEMLQAQFRMALADPGVSAIVLNINSPGGAVTGVGDFAAEVAAARKVKPVVAYGSGTVASAAYWIASAASQIVVSPTAVVGSIGVAMATSKQVLPDSDGRMQIEIVSSNAPDKRLDVATDSAGVASIVAMLDGIEAEFIAAIAANRRVSAATVKSDFGRGGVMVGKRATAAGMVDRTGTIDSVLTGLSAARPVGSSKSRAVAAAAVSEKVTMSDPTITSVAELTAAYPELVAGLRSEAAAAASTSLADVARTEGMAAGATAERARILGIEEQALAGHEALVAAFKADGKTTPAEAAIAIVKAERAAPGRMLSALADDGAKGPKVVVTTGQKGEQPAITAAAASDRIAAKVAKATSEGRTLSVAEAGAQVRAELRAAA